MQKSFPNERPQHSEYLIGWLVFLCCQTLALAWWDSLLDVLGVDPEGLGKLQCNVPTPRNLGPSCSRVPSVFGGKLVKLVGH